MTSPTSGNNGGQRFEPAPARVDVPVMRYEDAPAEWKPSLKLVFWLADLFPDQVIDIAELPSTPSPDEDPTNGQVIRNP